jgi:hypothetical protein
VDPDHGALAVPCPTQSQCFAPQLLLVFRQLIRLLGLFLLAALLVLVLSRCPPLFSALVYELVRSLLERGDGEKGKLVVFGQFARWAWYYHGRHLFICLVEVLHSDLGDGDEVGVEVLGVLDERWGLDDGDEGLGGEVAGSFPLSRGEGALSLVVLGELGLDVVVDALYFLRELAGIPA